MGVGPAEVGEGGAVRSEQVETAGPKSGHVVAGSLGVRNSETLQKTGNQTFEHPK